MNSDPVEFAYQIINNHHELKDLREEVRRLRVIEEKYDKLLSECMKYSEVMSANMIKMYIKGHEQPTEQANATNSS